MYSTVNFSPVLQLGPGSPVASWWLPMDGGGRLQEGWKFKMVPSSHWQTWHRQGYILSREAFVKYKVIKITYYSSQVFNCLEQMTTKFHDQQA